VLGSLLTAGLLVSLAGVVSFQVHPALGAVFALLAVAVFFYGANAAGIMLMDEAQGMVMRNAVILVDQIDSDIAAGVPAAQAVEEATVRRSRPVVLTATAAVLAMVPLVGNVFWGPMAIAPFADRGWIHGQRLQDYVSTRLNNRTIEQLPRRVVIGATRRTDKAPVFFTSGNTGVAVRASSAVPGILSPVGIDKFEYEDGDESLPLAVRAARQAGHAS
jgi:AcrB/AcrD/AcrF family